MLTNLHLFKRSSLIILCYVVMLLFNGMSIYILMDCFHILCNSAKYSAAVFVVFIGNGFSPIQESLMPLSGLVGFLAHTMTNVETPKVVFLTLLDTTMPRVTVYATVLDYPGKYASACALTTGLVFRLKNFLQGAKLLTIEGYTVHSKSSTNFLVSSPTK